MEFICLPHKQNCTLWMILTWTRQCFVSPWITLTEVIFLSVQKCLAEKQPERLLLRCLCVCVWVCVWFMWQSVDLRTAVAGFAFCYQIERLPLLRGLRNAGRNRLMRRESRVGSCRAITLPQVVAAAGWLNGEGDLQPELWWQSDYKLCATPLCSSCALDSCKTWQNKDGKSGKRKVGRHPYNQVLP